MLTPELELRLRRCKAVVVGASAGAVNALNQLLPNVAEDARVPVVVIVHLPANRPSLLPELFESRCSARVAEPEDKQPMTAGTIWFAPSNYHLLIENDLSFSLSVDAPVNFSRPSIDVTFETASDALGPELCAIVLTGANEDGAHGARVIRHRGGLVVAQDPLTAEAREMPSATISLATPQIVATLPEIATLIRQATQRAS